MARILTILILSATIPAGPVLAEGDSAGRPLLRDLALGLLLRQLPEDFLQRIPTLPGYLPPEILPNGDILIRRQPPADAPTGPIDL